MTNENTEIKPILELVDCNYNIGPASILKNINGAIYPGEVVFLVGKSGSGKSTLLKLLAGLIYPSSGDIRIRGLSLKKAKNTDLIDLNKKSGFVFQDNALISNMTIYDNIKLPMEYHEVASPKQMDRKIKALLQSMDLSDDTYKRPSGLSFGEQKMAAIARVMVTHPDLIYLDEPFANLDMQRVKYLEQIVNNWRLKKTSLVIVAHELPFIEKFADRIWVIRDQKLTYDIDCHHENFKSGNLEDMIFGTIKEDYNEEQENGVSV